MKNALKWVVLTPLAVVLLIFALINRQTVTVSFDPFGGTPPAFAVTAPLFVVLGLAAMIGVIAGGIATWFAQGRHRRAARQARAEAQRLRTENERLAAAARAKATALAPPPGELPRSAA
jgi:uncharacterized integral membrane protein